MTIKVLIVDDSAVVRQTLERELRADPELEVVGTAPDPYVARDKIVQLKPDVITLDIEMPRMDGVSFLRKLMEYHPLPVIILSSLSSAGSQTALDALAAGAVEVMCKPGASYTVGEVSRDLREKIRAAAGAKIKKHFSSGDAPAQPVVAPRMRALSHTTEKVITIGASTGGTQAIEAVLKQFPANAPGTIIVQHMPVGFTAAFAERLNRDCAVEVQEAKDGDSIVPGKVLIAPGNMHMMVKRSGARYLVVVKDGPLVGYHKPSVNVLFNSAAEVIGPNAVAVMLTGMGQDGAQGMLAMHRAGAHTVAQDEASSVVYGMPKAAVEAGGVDISLPLQEIAPYVLGRIEGKALGH